MNSPLQFIDLKKQQKSIFDQINHRIKTVLSHGKYIMGPEVGELEDQLAHFCKAKHAISCASGTDALLMALMAKGVGPGDAVFTTPFTFIATAETISLLGATPVFVDIDPDTFNIDPDQLEKKIQMVSAGKVSSRSLTGNQERNGSLKPRGIISVDLFGLPADYPRINDIAQNHGLFVIEDGAQSFGGQIKQDRACNLSDLGTTSFFPAKPLGCYGDGGAVFTNDDDLAAILRSIRVHGKGNDKYDNVRIGINGRLDTLQAAILIEKLNIFPEEIESRNKVARRYTELLSGQVKTPAVPQGFSSVWAQYSIICENRKGLIDKLNEKKIPTAVYYPKPLHLQTAYAFLGYQTGDFPVSEYCSEHILSLPMHPYLEEEEICFIANAVKDNC